MNELIPLETPFEPHLYKLKKNGDIYACYDPLDRPDELPVMKQQDRTWEECVRYHPVNIWVNEKTGEKQYRTDWDTSYLRSFSDFNDKFEAMPEDFHKNKGYC